MRWVFLGSLLFLSACFPVRSYFLGIPDTKDGQRFSQQLLNKSTSVFNFDKSTEDWSSKIHLKDENSKTQYFNPVLDVLKNHNARAFLLIKDDEILIEYYQEDLNSKSLHPSYSVAKSFVSALIGFAIQDGLLKSENDLVVEYLPELKDHPESASLKISHLLNMTSGLEFNVSSDAQIYYGNDVWKAVKNLDFEFMPGTKQRYINLNYQLLGLIIERITKQPISNYLQEKIWNPLGMESNAFWSADKKGSAKTFCCLNATAIDFAKFGRLFLNDGNWNGTQLLSEDWVKKSISRDESEGGSYTYHYGWHLGLKAYKDYMADGMFKQYVYMMPEKEVIIVLLMEREKRLKAEKANWRNIFRQIVDQL